MPDVPAPERRMHATPVTDTFCYLCGSSRSKTIQTNIRDLEYGSPGVYEWKKCEECGIIRLHPFPTPEAFRAAYPVHYNGYVEPKSKILGSLIKLSRRKQAKYLLKWIKPGESVLDVGCSTGELLRQLSDLGNFKLYGSEYSEWTAQLARAKGFEVWQGDFEKADIPRESMDLVSMNHVLEHVENCMHTLEKVFEVLKPGGYVVGEIPNIDSWDGHIFGKYWGGSHAPRHIWHFSPQTLRLALQKAGFEVLSIETNPRSGHFWALSMQNWFRRKRKVLTDLRGGRAWYYPLFILAGIPLHILQGLFSYGGVISFVARKREL